MNEVLYIQIYYKMDSSEFPIRLHSTTLIEVTLLFSVFHNCLSVTKNEYEKVWIFNTIP